MKRGVKFAAIGLAVLSIVIALGLGFLTQCHGEGLGATVCEGAGGLSGGFLAFVFVCLGTLITIMLMLKGKYRVLLIVFIAADVLFFTIVTIQKIDYHTTQVRAANNLGTTLYVPRTIPPRYVLHDAGVYLMNAMDAIVPPITLGYELHYENRTTISDDTFRIDEVKNSNNVDPAQACANSDYGNATRGPCGVQIAHNTTVYFSTGGAAFFTIGSTFFSVAPGKGSMAETLTIIDSLQPTQPTSLPYKN